MYATIQNSRVIYFAVNQRLCEARGRGFGGVDELERWEAQLPRDAWGAPLRPPAPFRVVELNAELAAELERLEAEGFVAGEIVYTEAQARTPAGPQPEKSTAMPPPPGADANASAGTLKKRRTKKKSAATPSAKGHAADAAVAVSDAAITASGAASPDAEPDSTPGQPDRAGRRAGPTLRGDDVARKLRADQALWQEIRALRNRRLAESDHLMLPDYSIAEKERQAWVNYRQQLRDLTQKFDDPEKLIWPDSPA